MGAFRYLQNLPFIYLKTGRVEDFMPIRISGSYITRTLADLLAVTDLTQDDVINLFYGINNAFYTINKDGGIFTCDSGSIEASGTLTPMLGMLAPYNGYTVKNDSNVTYWNKNKGDGEGVKVYQTGALIDTSCYVIAPIVDQYNHISVLTIAGEYPFTATYSTSDWSVKNVGYSSGFDNRFYALFEDEDWSSVEPDERSNLDMFDIEDRFSPRIAQHGIGCYKLTSDEVSDLFDDLWDTNNMAYFALNPLGVKPMDYIVTCKAYYGMRDDAQLSEDTACVVLGPYGFGGVWNSSGKMHKKVPVIKNEYAVHNFGTINIPNVLDSRIRGDYLDYAPFTKYQLYLPYVGYTDLNPNDFIDGVLGVKLNVNVITGQGLYVIYSVMNPHHQTIDGQIDGGGQVIMTIPCTLGVEIPFNDAGYGNLVSSLVRTIGSAVSIGATAGLASGVAAAGKSANALSMQRERIGRDMPHTAQNIAKMDELQDRANAISDNAVQGQIGVNALTQATGMIQVTPQTGRSGGGFNADTGSLGSLQPFLLVTLPIVATPNGFEDIYGNRCAVIDSLNNCDGFTQIVGVDPTASVSACKYQNEIIALLQSGVYLELTTPE